MNSRILTNDDIQTLEIEMTLQCQLHCHYCENLFKLRSNVNIDLALMKQLICNFKNLKKIQICGLGEPTLHPQLFDAIEFIHSLQNVQIQLVTNGTAKNDEYYNQLASILNRNDSILFTIYGSTNALHSYYRIGQTLDDLIHTIKIFKNSQAKTILEYVQMEYNHVDFEQCYINKSILQNVFSGQNIEINYLHDCWTMYERFNYTPAKNAKICTKATECVKNVYSMNIIAQNNDIAKKIFWCNSYDNKSLFIDSHGRIFPCSDMRLSMDSIEIQKILCKKHKSYFHNIDAFKASKQFDNAKVFNYDDIYALHNYRAICNQVDYATLKSKLYNS